MNFNDQFFHFRLYGQAGPRRMSGTSHMLSRGGVTIHTKVDSDGNMTASWAICAPEDAYNKSIGRTKANGQLLAKNGRTGTINIKEMPESAVLAWLTQTARGAFSQVLSRKMRMNFYALCQEHLGQFLKPEFDIRLAGIPTP